MSNSSDSLPAEDGATPSQTEILRERMKSMHEKMAQMRAEGWKPLRLNPVEQSKANPRSLKLAIKAHCWTCVGQDADPGAKFRVRDCAVGEKCSLYPHRPWQNAKGRVSLNDDGVLEATTDSEDTNDE